jgi:hypothetical protein
MTDDEIGTLWAERNALEAIITTLRAERDALRNDVLLLESIVSSDSIAMTYQTMGQYRTALLKILDAALEVQP